MWAIKIFDDRGGENNTEFLNLAKRWGAGIECALYAGKGMGQNIDTRLKNEFSGKEHAIGLHLNHSAMCILDLVEHDWSHEHVHQVHEMANRHEAIRAPGQKHDRLLSAPVQMLAREAGWASNVGIRDAVIHLQRVEHPVGLSWRVLNPTAYAIRCARVIDMVSALGLRMHMEKTFESRAWLDSFYAQIARQGQAAQFGFTFDMGHSRIWEVEPLEAWMESIARYEALGFGLHFHLHANAGQLDSHDTLSHGHAFGWLDVDTQWAPNGVMPVLREIQRLYEHKALLVLENNSDYAAENLGWVELAMRG